MGHIGTLHPLSRPHQGGGIRNEQVVHELVVHREVEALEGFWYRVWGFGFRAYDLGFEV